jgi:hypothetical protein
MRFNRHWRLACPAVIAGSLATTLGCAQILGENFEGLSPALDGGADADVSEDARDEGRDATVDVAREMGAGQDASVRDGRADAPQTEASVDIVHDEAVAQDGFLDTIERDTPIDRVDDDVLPDAAERDVFVDSAGVDVPEGHDGDAGAFDADADPGAFDADAGAFDADAPDVTGDGGDPDSGPLGADASDAAPDAPRPTFRKNHLVWRSTSSGDLAIWRLDRNLALAASTTVAQAVESRYQIVGAGDLSADGSDDLVWRDSTSGNVNVWTMVGAQHLATFDAVANADASWALRIADLDADGVSDFVWEQDGSWNVAAAIIRATPSPSVARYAAVSSASSEWQLSAAIDLSGDRKADLLWFAPTSGVVSAWPMDGPARTSPVELGSGVEAKWQVGAVGDFDGNGLGDILWLSDVNEISLWLFQGNFQWTSPNVILNLGIGWSLAAVADLDGDGRSDIVSRHTDGTVRVWRMQGQTILETKTVGTISSDWVLSCTMGAPD